MARSEPPNSNRTPEQIRHHYEVEKELAIRLRNSSPEERTHLYAECYDELYRRVPDHPQITRKDSREETRRLVDSQMRLLRHFLGPSSVFLEIGPGDCTLSLEVTEHAKQVYAVDVSELITTSETVPDNFSLILSDGRSIPVERGVIDIAYSNQLMEHLHPDDAVEQLHNIYESLVPGGLYICNTPNRHTGPWDISKHFDEVATGFHLKEYTIRELRDGLKAAGFSGISKYFRVRGRYVRLPLSLFTAIEWLVEALPTRLRKRVLSNRFLQLILMNRLVAKK